MLGEHNIFENALDSMASVPILNGVMFYDSVFMFQYLCFMVQYLKHNSCLSVNQLPLSVTNMGNS